MWFDHEISRGRSIPLQVTFVTCVAQATSSERTVVTTAASVHTTNKQHRIFPLTVYTVFCSFFGEKAYTKEESTLVSQ